MKPIQLILTILGFIPIPDSVQSAKRENGQWSPWEVERISPCRPSCKKIVFYRRACRNPAPSGGNTSCIGTTTRIMLDDCICTGAARSRRSVVQTVVAIPVILVIVGLAGMFCYFRWKHIRKRKSKNPKPKVPVTKEDVKNGQQHDNPGFSNS